ncbi:hypothetical protein M9Y10_002248 [Tritrichomonas musculus]|uniref:Peptidase M60 domain-containing protein n=1 Tax=Tritrichomonas musculus TaxID=1915356 RepID=A0ABR2L994_9EUKA
MGCASSTSVRVSNSYKVKKKEEEQSFKPIDINDIDESLLHSTFESTIQFLLRRVQSIRCPSGMVPAVVLSQLSIPILISKMSFYSDKSSTSIQLPIVVCTFPLIARIICFSHQKMLSHAHFRIDETSIFFHNCFTWLLSNFPDSSQVLFIEFPDDLHTEITNCLKTIFFTAEFSEYDDNMDLSKYHCIAITSKFNTNGDQSKLQKLQEYVDKGNGVAIFYDFTNSLLDVPINSFIKQYGISFTYCQLSDEYSPPILVPVQNNKISSQIINLSYYLDTLKSLLVDNNNFGTSELDNIVAFLRYHIMVCQKEQFKLLIEIKKCCYDFLKKTEYQKDNKLCPESVHVIIAILLIDIINKLPPEELKVSPDAHIFPGIQSNLKLSDHSVTLRLHEESIISTGLWCQPGVVSTIECHNPPKNLQIQIGSHSLSLIANNGPWKRWPTVTTRFNIEDGITKVASPFGGIIYLVVGQLSENSPSHIDLRFNQFCKHTLVVNGKPEVYQMTKNLEAPWCEIILNTVIFTVPSNRLSLIQNFDESLNFIEKHVQKVAEVASYTIIRPYRIVFDYEITERFYVADYPIFLNIIDFDDIFVNQNSVTPGFFKLLMAISEVSLRDNCFDKDTEYAVSAYIAANAINQVDPLFDPMVFFDIDLPLLFRLLWNIHSELNKNIITSLIKDIQENGVPDSEVPEDLWIYFVKNLCLAANCNLINDLLSLRPIPLNIISMLQNLPPPPFNVI